MNIESLYAPVDIDTSSIVGQRRVFGCQFTVVAVPEFRYIAV